MHKDKEDVWVGICRFVRRLWCILVQTIVCMPLFSYESSLSDALYACSSWHFWRSHETNESSLQNLCRPN